MGYRKVNRLGGGPITIFPELAENVEEALRSTDFELSASLGDI